MISLCIIDYDSGNVRSVAKAFERIGAKVSISNSKNIIKSSNGVILPGQGSFGDCMDKLKKYDLIDIVDNVLNTNKPFLGICVGLQLLFEKSYEFGEHKGFGFFKGLINRFPQTKNFKIPHIGWNTVSIRKKNELFRGIPTDTYFYFVHSYYAKSEEVFEIATTDYIVEFSSAINMNNVYGVQFHPEKSQVFGLRVLKNFVSICEEA